MNVGIVEIFFKGHYPAVNACMKTYASSKDNKVYVFTVKEVAANLYDLDQYPNITIITKTEDEDIKAFLAKIEQYDLDRIHIQTFEFQPEMFFSIIGTNTYLLVHNIDNVFRESVGNPLMFYFQNIYLVLVHHNNLELIKRFFHYLKEQIMLEYWKNRCVKKLTEKNGVFVVLSENMKEHLASVRPDIKVVSIPFSVYEGNTNDVSPAKGEKVRVCIPGTVDLARRDYLSLFDSLGQNIDMFKNNMELDLLGYVNEHKRGSLVVERAQELIDKGLKVHIHRAFIDPAEFDESLSKASILLGNMNVRLHKYSKYSLTKETGVSYCMIRAAKPGILPREYRGIIKLESSTVYYDEPADLLTILKKLVNDRDLIHDLTRKAEKNSEHFTASRLYEDLNRQESGFDSKKIL